MKNEKEKLVKAKPVLDAYILGTSQVKVFIRGKVYTKKEGEGGYVFMSVPELLESVSEFMRALEHRETTKLEVEGK